VTLVDTNVLLDVFTEDPKWLGWSLARLEEAAFKGPLLINDVIYAETSTRHPAMRILKPRWLPPASRLR
jgi:predicted nucleic-acid-binding protein